MTQGNWLRRSENDLTVIFIHGINSSEECWSHQNGVYWPELLKAENDFSSIGIYVFSYRTSISTGYYSLGDVVDSLKEYLRLDNVLDNSRVIFVCHSMGGIVARRFLVSRQSDLLKEGLKEAGLFLVASPSLGAEYATMLSWLSKIMGHTQADALRFSQANTWLNDLDKDFVHLRDTGKLTIKGKELIEDLPILLKGFLRSQVVKPFSGARYFDEPYKVPSSDHFTIARPADARSIQHRLLCSFIKSLRDEDKQSVDPKIITENKGTTVSLQTNAIVSRGVQGKSKGSIFVSYSSSDRHHVERLVSALLLNGVDVWYDQFDIRVGENIYQKIQQGIIEVDFLGVILTKNSLASTWVEEELSLAKQRELEEKSVILLPLLFEKVQLPLHFRMRKYADFTEFDTGFRELMRVFGKRNVFDGLDDAIRTRVRTVLSKGLGRDTVVDMQGITSQNTARISRSFALAPDQIEAQLRIKPDIDQNTPVRIFVDIQSVGVEIPIHAYLNEQSGGVLARIVRALNLDETVVESQRFSFFLLFEGIPLEIDEKLHEAGVGDGDHLQLGAFTYLIE